MRRAVALAVACGLLTGAGCPEDDPAPTTASEVDISLSGFAPNHPFFAYYELWVRFDDPQRGLNAVSLGMFKADGVGEPLIMGGGPLAIADDEPGVPRHPDGSPDWARAVEVLLTIEPEIDGAPGPNLPAMVAGPFVDGEAVLVTNAPGAIEASFGTASGSFVLATPTTTATDDEDEGVWFTSPDGTSPSLGLPSLTTGWHYQAWVGVPTLGDFSLGTFTGPSGIDSDGAGSSAGSEPGFLFPGSDFPSGQGNVLHTANVFITLEPPGNADSASGEDKPFFLLLLQRSIQDQPPGVSVPLTNRATGFPIATVSLRAAS